MVQWCLSTAHTFIFYVHYHRIGTSTVFTITVLVCFIYFFKCWLLPKKLISWLINKSQPTVCVTRPCTCGRCGGDSGALESAPYTSPTAPGLSLCSHLALHRLFPMFVIPYFLCLWQTFAGAYPASDARQPPYSEDPAFKDSPKRRDT